MLTVEGKVALVTGASSGIGEGISRCLSEHGATVYIGDIDQENGRNLANTLGPSAHFLKLDVTREADWAAAAAEIERAHGRLDILVNNAGAAAAIQRLTAETTEDFERITRLNINGVWFGIRAAVPLMRRANGGSIINIASIDSFIGVAGMTTYVTTKFAVLGLTKSAALELGTFGIRVNAVHPGIIATPAVARLPDAIKNGLQDAVSRQPIGRLGTPADVANAVLFFASDQSAYCTGSSLVVDGGHIAGRYRELSD